ncbi:hypothetical protein J1605_006335 [Eschrichtius robustus]|uniref:Uncharacterized protein n=1 Tax=Eschrichtius robustus TaxID=9764 RepID=A0AB34GTF4_ESCRO|nr:hypothetical protein J1605_010648 [Eschrichtius robustus]KAJ8786360.1 hypothetical protein J1605_006335 [Eschrichtius robustus]
MRPESVSYLGTSPSGHPARKRRPSTARRAGKAQPARLLEKAARCLAAGARGGRRTGREGRLGRRAPWVAQGAAEGPAGGGRVEAHTRRQGAPFPARRPRAPPPPAPSAPCPAQRRQTRRATSSCQAASAVSARPGRPPGSARGGAWGDRACGPSLPAAGPVSRSSAAPTAPSAPSLRTMGPRWLLLVAAGLSLCGPLLSARARGPKPARASSGMGRAGGGGTLLLRDSVGAPDCACCHSVPREPDGRSG